jgi:aarF domain-containing kinase
MAGRRLVDVAKLINASRSIAKQHIALRSQQLDVYNKTSTLAKAVKDQTDRVTLTARAAIALSKRLNETELPHNTTYAPSRHDSDEASIPRKETAHEAQRQAVEQHEGLKQDHHYGTSEGNAVTEPPAEQELKVRQEKPPRHPLPDGTIPPEGAKIGLHPSGKDTYSRRPQSEPDKHPLEQEHQGEDELEPAGSHRANIPDPTRTQYSSKDARELQRQSESQIPTSTSTATTDTAGRSDLHDGHDRDVYYERPTGVNKEYSSLPRAKLPKHTETSQGQAGSRQQDVDADVFSDQAREKQAEQVLEKEKKEHEMEVPEGVNINVFRTTRASKTLGGNPYQRNEASPLHSQAQIANSGAAQPLASGESADDIQSLGAELARDTETTWGTPDVSPFYQRQNLMLTS